MTSYISNILVDIYAFSHPYSRNNLQAQPAYIPCPPYPPGRPTAGRGREANVTAGPDPPAAEGWSGTFVLTSSGPKDCGVLTLLLVVVAIAILLEEEEEEEAPVFHPSAYQFMLSQSSSISPAKTVGQKEDR